MPTMSGFESAVCRSAPWRLMTRRVALPWAMQGLIPGVLKPGGRLIGYDLMNGWAARTLHSLEGAPYRLIHRDELEPALRELPLEQVQVRHNPMLARFAAVKSG